MTDLAARVLRNIPTADAREHAAKREVMQRCPDLVEFVRHCNTVFGQVALDHAEDGTGWEYGERSTGWVRVSAKPLEGKRRGSSDSNKLPARVHRADATR